MEKMKVRNVEDEFEKDGIVKTILKFSLPSAIASIISLLCVLTDRYFIGQVAGRAGMAAVTIVYPYMMIINGINFLFSGVGILIGVKLGQGRKKSAELYLGSTFFWIIVSGLTLSALLWVLNERLLLFFGGEPAGLDSAREYTKYIIPSALFQIFLGQTIILRSIGEPVKAMVINVATALINIVLDYIFVMRMGMGIGGAAFATLISTVITSLTFIYYITQSEVVKLRLKNIVPNIRILKEVAQLGSPRFYNQILQALLIVITNKNAGYYGGEIATAAIGIITVVRNTINTAMQGFNQGTAAIISYFFGAKLYKKMANTLRIQLKIVGSFTLFMVTMMFIFSKDIAGFFVKDDVELIIETAKGMKLNLFLMFFTVIFLSCNNFLQGIKHSNLATKYFLIRIVVLNIPLVYILGKLFGIVGVWLAFPVADTIAGILIYLESRKILKNIEKN